MNSSILKAVSVGLLALPLLAFQDADPRIITVEGRGYAEAPADGFSIFVDITAVENDQEQALRSVSDRLTAIREGLAQMDGLEEVTFNFTELDVDAVRAGCDRSRREQCPVTGWRVYAPLSISGKPAIEGANAVSLVAELGASEIDDLDYHTDNPAELVDAARVDAIRNARMRAEQLAEAAGMRVTSVQQISYGRGHNSRAHHIDPNDDRIVVTGSRIRATVRFEADDPVRFENESVTVSFIIAPLDD